MSNFDPSQHPHRRFNPLTAEWVLVAPHRTQRPWQGQLEAVDDVRMPEFDADCYLCPGNARASGDVNPDYTGTYAFDNDFSSLLPDVPDGQVNVSDLLVARGEAGRCRVLCYSPKHNLTMAEMSVDEIYPVVSMWTEQYVELGSDAMINHVQIFENKGAAMGCSNPHPHGQVWAQQTIPDEPAKEQVQMERYLGKHGSTLLSDYRDLEAERDERIVCANDTFIALVPYWAVWPFEVMVIPRRHRPDLTHFDEADKRGLSDILRRVTARYDNLFQCSFPYSMGLHQSPTDGKPHPEWDFHIHFYPPLLRSATVKKFIVGYEMLAGPQRDITPELSAARLRELSETHFRVDTGL